MSKPSFALNIVNHAVIRKVRSEHRLWFSRMKRQRFSTGFSPGDFGDSGKMVMLVGATSLPVNRHANLTPYWIKFACRLTVAGTLICLRHASSECRDVIEIASEPTFQAD